MCDGLPRLCRSSRTIPRSGCLRRIWRSSSTSTLMMSRREAWSQ